MLTFIQFIIFGKYERRRTSNASLLSREIWQHFMNLPCWVDHSEVSTAIYQFVQMD